MPIPGLDPDKCAQRNRIAARRDGVDSAPVLLLSEAPAELSVQLASSGTLPKTAEEALKQINALRTGGDPLTEDQVWIHYMEAANGNFIADRYMFLGVSTLKNIAKQAVAGVAFMNSHRTGGMSHPSELPFGRTFAGRYEQNAEGARALLAVYMLRGQRPNGDSGPSTDDLHTGIDGGTIFDVSVGIYGGDLICDVCGEDLMAYGDDGWLCPHLPGTHYGMSEAQKRAQKARGVTDGCATYTYENGIFSEVSSVYDGAVPGAGFRKALSLCRAGELDAASMALCRSAYVKLARAHDFDPSRFRDPKAVQELAEGLSALWGEGDEDSGAPPAGVPFAEQVETALAAVRACVDRGREVQEKRAAEGRTLSAARLAQFEDVETALRELRELVSAPRGSVDAAALRVKALRLRAAELPAGS